MSNDALANGNQTDYGEIFGRFLYAGVLSAVAPSKAGLSAMATALGIRLIYKVHEYDTAKKVVAAVGEIFVLYNLNWIIDYFLPIPHKLFRVIVTPLFVEYVGGDDNKNFSSAFPWLKFNPETVASVAGAILGTAFYCNSGLKY